MKARLIVAAALLASQVSVGHALEIYGIAGLPIVGVGVAQDVLPQLSIRAEYGLLPAGNKEVTEEGIRYQAKSTVKRAGFFGDWFILRGGFRITTGLTFNDQRIDLQARPTGGTLDIGGTVYAVGPNDGLDVRIEYPDTTPYLGIGWGHHSGARGWSFVADLGVAIGKAKVTATPRGALASAPGIQASVDAELQELRDGAGKVRAIPQLTVGVGYRF